MAMLSHRQGWSFAIALVVFPSLFFASSTDDPPPAATYRAGTSEVRVSFFVTDENNRLVSNVGPDDFAVVDDGVVIRRFRSLMRSNETALDVVVMLDASQSVASRFRPALTEVSHVISEKPLATDDNLSVISFAGLKPALLCSGDCRTTAAAQKLVQTPAEGQTPLYDALLFASRFTAARATPGVRQVLVLFSDGNDTISRTSQPDAVQAVIATGALLYAVDIAGPGRTSRGSSLLREMAETSGGRYFPSRESGAAVLEAALADQQASYVVTYPLPSHVAGIHSLRLLPKHNLNLHFHCRSSYYYEKNLP
ncbi:MAG TPA: VWA domain-containing protein [Verrucomicrobiae bacterium]|nr:VWA domain-containing protein [Verrucomicrobiae bacterium]